MDVIAIIFIILLVLIFIRILSKKKGNRKEIGIQKTAFHNKKRSSTKILYKKGITKNKFKEIVIESSTYYSRLGVVNVDDAVVYSVVRSKTGKSFWHFELDFNDWGKITGNYWIRADDYNSNIPYEFAVSISLMIQKIVSD